MYGVGSRIPLRYSRAIVDAIHSGELASAEYETFPVFNLRVPTSCTGVPTEYLHPNKTWLPNNKTTFDIALSNLAKLFNDNFQKYSEQATSDIIAAGPTL